jgi:hypothetical protein
MSQASTQVKVRTGQGAGIKQRGDNLEDVQLAELSNPNVLR